MTGATRSPSLTEQEDLSSLSNRREDLSIPYLDRFSQSPHRLTSYVDVFLSKRSLFLQAATAPRPEPPNAPEFSATGPPSNPDKGHLSVTQAAGYLRGCICKLGLSTDPACRGWHSDQGLSLRW